MIGEEQCGFRQGRGCADQVFLLKNVSEKYKVLVTFKVGIGKPGNRMDVETMTDLTTT